MPNLDGWQAKLMDTLDGFPKHMPRSAMMKHRFHQAMYNQRETINNLN
jgi:hypothetical protein